jgi:hypothetical protein
MKFQSPGDPIQLSLTTGHTFVVGQEPVEVPQMFYIQAHQRGCVPVDSGALPPREAQPAEQTKMDVICGEIVTMLGEKDRTGLFIGDGRPDLVTLSKRVGFQVSSSERDEAWVMVSKAIG